MGDGYEQSKDYAIINLFSFLYNNDRYDRYCRICRPYLDTR
jgi:hypothetical protein